MYVMSETQSQSRTEERLTDIEPDLAREIVTESQETHLVFIYADERPDNGTVIKYRAVGRSAVVRFASPAAEYAYHGDADDVWTMFGDDIQAELDSSTAADVGEIVVEYERGDSPIDVPDLDFGENVRFEVSDK